jgi:DNA transformation protein
VKVSQGYLDWILEQLATLGEVRARRMFGGAGLYLGADFFAIVADDTLYLKVDETNRHDFESRGMRSFRPYPGQPTAMRYYEVPAEVLEDPDELARWARGSVAAARRRAGRGGASPSRQGRSPRR